MAEKLSSLAAKRRSRLDEAIDGPAPVRKPAAKKVAPKPAPKKR